MRWGRKILLKTNFKRKEEDIKSGYPWGISEKGKEMNEYCICNQEQLKMTSPGSTLTIIDVLIFYVVH